jgi:F420-dependent oxidoreductase-like protein
MKLGLQIPSFDWPGSPQNIGATLQQIARTADEGGFASLWVMDHFFGIGSAWGPPEAPMLEGYTTLAYMAAATRQLRLGVLVTGAFYRHPGVLIKTVTTLDVLSGGRAYFGVGSGWYERESRGLGVPFPPQGERFDRLEETLRIAHQMWRGDTAAYAGRHYHLEEPLNYPPALSRPHPPILVGGEGERRTLALVARYADACNFQLGTPLLDYPDWYREQYTQRVAHISHKLAVLQQHCEAVGRDFRQIEPTVLGSARLGPGAMSSAEIVEVCHELAELGVRQVIYNMPDVHTIVPLEQLARDVIPAIAAL